MQYFFEKNTQFYKLFYHASQNSNITVIFASDYCIFRENVL